MDLCPQRWPSGAVSVGAGSATRAGLVAGVPAARATGVSTTAPTSRRLVPVALLRAAYLASRIALWASTLLIAGSRHRAYDLRCRCNGSRRIRCPMARAVAATSSESRSKDYGQPNSPSGSSVSTDLATTASARTPSATNSHALGEPEGSRCLVLPPDPARGTSPATASIQRHSSGTDPSPTRTDW